MRVLVTGSSGHIGSAVAERLQRDADVIVPGSQTTHIGDIRNRKLIPQIVTDVDLVVHAAALLTPHVGVRPESDFHDINVAGTANLLQCAIQAGVQRFVFTSTTSVYGCTTQPRGDAAIWVTEDLPPHPEDIYDATKLDAERLCRRAAEEQGLTCIALRMSRCFPEPDHLMTFYRLYRGVHARDVAEGHSLALHVPLTGFHIFNLSAKSPFHTADCRELWSNPWDVIGRHFPNGKAEFSKRIWPLPERIDRVYDIAKAEELLSFRPQFNFASIFHEGIRGTRDGLRKSSLY